MGTHDFCGALRAHVQRAAPYTKTKFNFVWKEEDPICLVSTQAASRAARPCALKHGGWRQSEQEMLARRERQDAACFAQGTN